MSTCSWITRLRLSLPLGFLCWAAAATAANAAEADIQGIAIARTATALLLELRNGRTEEIPAAQIGRLQSVAPGALVRLDRTAPTSEAAKQHATTAAAQGAGQQFEDEAAADRLRPLQAVVIGRQLAGTVEQIADDQTWIVLRGPALPVPKDVTAWQLDKLQAQALRTGQAVAVSIQVDTDLRTVVKSMQAGDGVTAVLKHATGNATPPTTNTLVQVEWRKAKVGGVYRAFVLAAAALVLLLLGALFTGGSPASLFLGADNRYSSSKFQTVLWFWVVTSAYLATVLLRLLEAGIDYIGGVDIPANLLMLSGLSVLGATGAKMITMRKVEAAPALKPSANAPSTGDLVNDDVNRTDLGDFQLIVMTGIAVAIYAVSAWEFMAVIELRRIVTMRDVDSTLLALFGLSQAGYLGKKVAGDAGAGLTSQQATQQGAGQALAVKENTMRLQDVAKRSGEQIDAASAARAATAAAADKAAAERDATAAEAASKAAAALQLEAAALFKTIEAQVAGLSALATTWAKDTQASPLLNNALLQARAELTKASAFASASDDAAKRAADAAIAARDTARNKP
jgi:hypothetical protein